MIEPVFMESKTLVSTSPELNGMHGVVRSLVLQGQPGRVGVEVLRLGREIAVRVENILPRSWVTSSELVPRDEAEPEPEDMGRVEEEPNAQVSAAILHSKPQEQINAQSVDGESHPGYQIYLDAYSKTPKEWKDALETSQLLKSCRHALTIAGYSWELQDSGAKIFVRPEHFDAVSQALAEHDLQKYNVIVAEEFVGLLEETIQQMSSRKRPKLKDRRTVLTLHMQASSSAHSGQSIMNSSAERSRPISIPSTASNFDY